MVRRFDDIDAVIEFLRELPEFPEKPLILECLKTRNRNRYHQALEIIGEARTTQPSHAELLGQLEVRVKGLGASDPIAD